MGYTRIRYLVYFAAILHTALGCEIAPVQPVTEIHILDTARNDIFRHPSPDVIDIISQSHGGDEPNRPPYLNAYLDNGEFVLEVDENFESYEEYETRLVMSYTITFSCVGTPSAIQVFSIIIQDTNNHEPRFLPTNEILFTIHPPLAPNFLLTGCSDQIVVRDIDLTTSAIIFGIEDNDYIEILPDTGSNIPNSKEFKGLVRTKTLIRSMSEPLTLRISATDVDDTEDAPHTVYGTIVIQASEEFEVPDDLVFTETYYTATYREEHSVILDETISLQQGFDDEVDFELSGDWLDHFTLTGTGNSRSLTVASPLPTHILNDNSQVYLIITAKRNLVTPTTATIVINLPQVIEIAFEELHFEGTITDNVLVLQELKLEEGYQNGFSVEIISEYSTSFSYSINNVNGIVLTMAPLDQSVLEQNSFISLQVKATTSTSTATALVTLDIIKDDTTTPVFENINYIGTYNPSTGLDLANIVLIQGYDNTVQFSKDEDHGSFFGISNSNNVVTLTANIPPEVLESEQQLIFTVHATKERTVGAMTTVIINLPLAPVIAFEQLQYEGRIIDNVLTVPELKLEQGYQNGFAVEIVSEYSTSFSYSINDVNGIVLTMTPLDQSVLEQNSFISLQVKATTATSTATALVTLDIIKDDTTTPVFENINYIGTYNPSTGLDLANIVLIQGYDNTVQFSKDEDHGSFFGISNSNNVVTLTANIPPEVLESEQQLIFTVHATKERTVGAMTTIIINLPLAPVIAFEQLQYEGRIIDNVLTVPELKLEQGYQNGFAVEIVSEYSTSFSYSINDVNGIVLTMTPLDQSVLEQNSFISLQVKATTATSTATALVTLDIIKDDTTTPVFENINYIGTYNPSTGLDLANIVLIQGYDNTVQFSKDEEHGSYFELTNNNNMILLAANIPTEILENENQLVFTIHAAKERTVGASTTIIINLPQDSLPTTVLKFESSNYRGSIVDNTLQLRPIILIDGYNDEIEFDLDGDNENLFRINEDNAPSLTLELTGPIPDTIENIIVLELKSHGPGAISAYTTIIIETDTEIADIHLAFDKDFYTGTFTEELGLVIEAITLEKGFDESVLFGLEGEQSTWFTCTNSGNVVTISVLPPGIPDVVLANNLHLTFTIIAGRTGGASTTATIVIALPDDLSSRTILRFGQSSYRGSIENDIIILDTIVLTDGYTSEISFELTGDHDALFRINEENAPSLTLELTGPIPDTTERIIILELRSYGEDAISAYTTIILDTDLETADITLGFDKDFYTGTFTEELGLVIEAITLEKGFDESVLFGLEGEQSTWFTCTNSGNVVTISVLPPGIPDVVLANNLHLTFTIIAGRTGAASTTATIVIALPDDLSSRTILRFGQSSYRGSIENDIIILDTIVLTDGYTSEISFELTGDHDALFRINEENAPSLTLELTGPIPDTTERIIILELRSYGEDAISAYTTIILDTDLETADITLGFDKDFYTGTFTEELGLVIEAITLENGFDESVLFGVEGEQSTWFTCTNSGNVVTISVLPPGIPDVVLANNLHLTFTIIAGRNGAASTTATIVIALPDDLSSRTILRFGQSSYRGSIENDIIILDTIVLTDGYTNEISFELTGDHDALFRINEDNAPSLTLELTGPIPDTTERIIILELRSYGEDTISAYTTIILDTDLETADITLGFDKDFYTGTFTEELGLVIEAITLEKGFDESVLFGLEGEQSTWFTCTNSGNVVTISVLPPGIPDVVLANNLHLTFTIIAGRTGGASTTATIVIALPDDLSSRTILRFGQSSYRGSIENDIIILDTIVLTDGYTNEISFELTGDHDALFRINEDNAPSLTLELTGPIPDTTERIIILELRSYGEDAISAYTTIILDTDLETADITLGFDKDFYTGTFTEELGLVIEAITLENGFDESVLFGVEGEQSTWFTCTNSGNVVTISVLPPGIPDVVLANNLHLTFTIIAGRNGAASTTATIVIALPDDLSSRTILRFGQSSYRGSIENDIIILDTIVLTDGYTNEISFELTGDHDALFRINEDNAPSLTLELTGPIPDTTERIIILELRSYGEDTISAYTTIILDTDLETADITLGFDKDFYTGTFTEELGLVIEAITLEKGFDESVLFELSGDHAIWFRYSHIENIVTVSVASTGIPDGILDNNIHLTFSIIAHRDGSIPATAAIVIGLPSGSINEVYFDRALYNGIYESEELSHDVIMIIGYSGTTVNIHGEMSDLFTGTVDAGVVRVIVAVGITLPLDLNYVTLELSANTARTALVIEVNHSDIPLPPLVEFNPTFYVFDVDVTQTGVIGRVQATTNNGENLIYSLQIDNENLSERLVINSQGELHLSSPAPSGQYSFIVEARTDQSGASATANAQLTVNAITLCGEDRVVPPLIILERDEEEAHENLVVLDNDSSRNCHFTLTNRWPESQQWLTVDERGLHAAVIDREHESIAFMPVSQVQVELVLHCDTDELSRRPRSIQPSYNFTKLNDLGPYDYGSKKWILTDTILYNSRRTMVNLIVNDINDNHPIFIGKENEPLVVGYPVPELVEFVLPRALAIVQATDADIGENARLVYWSEEPHLAVARDTGAVHVRNNMQNELQDNLQLTISATDRSGADDGLTGNIALQVRLLDIHNIVIITIRDAFLDDENKILQDISQSLGYDVKSLRATVISDYVPEENLHLLHKYKRDIHYDAKNINDIGGAALQLYVYALSNTVPIDADELINDIDESDISTISITSTITLEDHIEDILSNSSNDTALFAATITLSVLVFSLIVFMILWYIFKVRKANSYDEFRDSLDNSVLSENPSVEIPKTESLTRERKVNIDEIKRSERRLQELLNAPIPEIIPEPLSSIVTEENTNDTTIDFMSPEKNAAIIIQSIDKLKDAEPDSEPEDEFGEVITKKRKSVVTFNENVEKIIHVEDNIDDGVPDVEIERF